jgi:hypothetical protein
MQYTILMGRPTISNMRYYWASPPASICNTRYYWVGPPYPICDITGPAHLPRYAIYDITGWAHHIQYVILLGQPTCLNMQYTILLGGPTICNTWILSSKYTFHYFWRTHIFMQIRVADITIYQQRRLETFSRNTKCPEIAPLLLVP